MNIEYEATFINQQPDNVRQQLQSVGAQLVKPDFQQRRINFDLPGSAHSQDSWLRVRDEGEKITLSLKTINGDAIENQKETQLVIDDFDRAVDLLTAIGCRKKQYQETKRELWTITHEGTIVEITIDTWPFLDPFVEIEGPNEAVVRLTAEKLNFDYNTAIFGSVNTIYAKKYGKTLEDLGPTFTELKFDIENPFQDR